MIYNSHIIIAGLINFFLVVVVFGCLIRLINIKKTGKFKPRNAHNFNKNKQEPKNE